MLDWQYLRLEEALPASNGDTLVSWSYLATEIEMDDIHESLGAIIPGGQFFWRGRFWQIIEMYGHHLWPHGARIRPW